MPTASQPDSAGLHFSPVEGRFAGADGLQTVTGDDGLEAVNGPEIVRLPPYASNARGQIALEASRATTNNVQTPIQPQSISMANTPITRGGSNGSPAIESHADDRESTSSGSDTGFHPKSSPKNSKRRCGLTLRQWFYVLGPSILIVIVAGVVAGILVAKERKEAPTTPTSSTPTSSNSSFLSKSGAFNGTDIALASPGLDNETLWMFYQNFEGNLAYAALDDQGRWHQKGTIPTSNGIANGSAITAINYPLHNPKHINLMYLDRTGQIRNKLYDHNGTREFMDGYLYKKIYTMPPNITSVRRMSWYADDNNLFYVYAGGEDGFLHEYTYNATERQWAPTSVFAASNGYSGCTVLAETSLSTMHLVSAEGNLQFWTRTPPPDNSTLESWTSGASSQLPVAVYRNSTLELDRKRGSVIYQDMNGDIQLIDLRGQGSKNPQWNAPISSNIKARLGTSIKSIDGSIYPGMTKQTHVFMQVHGNDIAHFVRANDSDVLSYLETPIN